MLILINNDLEPRISWEFFKDNRNRDHVTLHIFSIRYLFFADTCNFISRNFKFTRVCLFFAIHFYIKLKLGTNVNNFFVVSFTLFDVHMYFRFKTRTYLFIFFQSVFFRSIRNLKDTHSQNINKYEIILMHEIITPSTYLNKKRILYMYVL